MLLKEKIEIEKWLTEYGVEKYELISDEKYGYVVNVNGVVQLGNLDLKRLLIVSQENINCLKNKDIVKI